MTITDTKKPNITEADLRQFTGDLEHYQSINPCVIYTPGIRFLAERGEAYWLVDLIASYYVTPQMKRAMETDSRLLSLQFWKLVVDPTKWGVLSARADSDVPPFILQDIPYTDFSLDKIDIWSAFDGSLWTLYLPSEH